ncbi:uncharacterized protein SPSK_03771 [Sporothrix schenckii 1099-18]|uniref:Uncharacterized protein n=1 Tax=Sporothrix schenckii 1099-18 TaxID=1397361 RepID=A0A0F2LZV3_SPOSC|nr:uncharacterized protein SPSK_03771 [Sporothrix schenckii 1099-18]KJR82379.1 hypothetical protein SPSK_03771 [Sporothrix schenckii 1099-18]
MCPTYVVLVNVKDLVLVSPSLPATPRTTPPETVHGPPTPPMAVFESVRKRNSGLDVPRVGVSVLRGRLWRAPDPFQTHRPGPNQAHLPAHRLESLVM